MPVNFSSFPIFFCPGIKQQIETQFMILSRWQSIYLFIGQVHLVSAFSIPFWYHCRSGFLLFLLLFPSIITTCFSLDFKHQNWKVVDEKWKYIYLSPEVREITDRWLIIINLKQCPTENCFLYNLFWFFCPWTYLI